jgi:GWxTD domain-containing protein
MTLLALAPLALTAQIQREPEGGVILRAVRSYRAEHGQTQVDAFVQVPLRLMEPTKEGPDGMLSYRVEGKVTDSTGLTLYQQSWQNHAPAALDGSDAYAMDIIRFSVAPGRYRLQITAEDSVSGHKAESGIELDGFTSTPSASDLLLSPQIRPATASDTEPRPAELRWGRMLVTAAAELELTPLRSEAYYLLEAYSAHPVSGTLEVRVVDTTGKILVRSSPVSVSVDSGGGVLQGHLSLAGLPPARYTMTAALKLGKDSVERSASFVMAGLSETLEKDVARREASRVTDQGYFAEMNDAELNEAKDPLMIIAQSGELSSWDKSLSISAKRNFLTGFWARRDPTPDTPRNEAREDFYKKVEYANRAYRRASRDEAGWRSDRGRIYLRNGQPDDVLRQGAQGAGGRIQSRAMPYEVWHYTSSGKDRFYIFVDRAATGAFTLVHSNDVREVKLANWNEYFGKDDLENIQRFLGLEIFRDVRAF